MRPWIPRSGFVAASAAPALLVALAIAACGTDDEVDPAVGTADAPQCEEVAAPAPRQVDLEPPGRQQRLDRDARVEAIVETSCGTFEIELALDLAPRTAGSFVHLARNGVYDETLIHRIAPGFVIQAGDPSADGTGGPGYTIDEPPPPDTVYERGVVAMAKTGVEPPGRSGSQFFVVTAPADAGLPPDYALVGRVSEGMEVVELIGELGDADEQPTQTVVIHTVSIREQ